jgi:DNA-binding winged helix-turn-helix (wHTH) protein/TolB-like protein/Flp pilus assembly protein TadD
MNPRTLSFYEFGPFRINVTERLLQRGDELVPLSPKVFDTLLILVENHGHVVAKKELMQSLWPDTFVEESSLTQNISLLRRALTPLESERQYIETIPKRGYRFIGEVRHITEPSGVDIQPVPTIVDNPESVPPRPVDSFTDPHLSGVRLQESPRRFGRINFYVAAVAVCVLIGALITLGYRLRNRAAASESLAGKTIAVLPFKTIGADGEKELLGLGMADALIIRLSRLEELSVLPTGSVFPYTNRDKDAISIGKELAVDGVLDGTIQREGDFVRVTAQLIRVSDGKTVWSMKYDDRQNSIFALQDSISDQLAVSLVPELSATKRKTLWIKPTDNAEAYQSYLLGMHFWNRRTKENLAKAVEYLEDAVRKDQNFAQAHAILADCYFLSGLEEYRSMPMEEAHTRAEGSANRALELDDTIAEAHTVRAGLHVMRRQNDDAGRAFRRAIELKPTYAVAHLRYGYFLMWDLRIDDALMHMRRAQQVDPVSPIANAALGSMLLTARHFDESIKYSQRALELEPKMLGARLNLGDAYVGKRMFAEGIRELQKVPEDDEYAMVTKAYAYAVAGRREEAFRELAELQKVSGTKGAPYAYARIYGALGDKDKAFEWLEKINLGRTMVAWLKYDHQLDALRIDPRFTDFLKRHKLEHLLQS